MSQFTSVRGVNPELTNSEVLVDTRRAVEVLDRVDGVVESRVEGDLVVAVTPKGNDGTASIFVNGEKVYAAQPYTKDEEKKAFERLCKKVTKEFAADE